MNTGLWAQNTGLWAQWSLDLPEDDWSGVWTLGITLRPLMVQMRCGQANPRHALASFLADLKAGNKAARYTLDFLREHNWPHYLEIIAAMEDVS